MRNETSPLRLFMHDTSLRAVYYLLLADQSNCCIMNHLVHYIQDEFSFSSKPFQNQNPLQLFITAHFILRLSISSKRTFHKQRE